jgi:hypothetical protein
MTRWVLALAVLSLAAVQDEMIDNPEYQGWSKQKVGAWVKFKMSNDMGEMKMEGDVTTKLKEITAEKAVLDQVMAFDMMGQKREQTMSRTAPAKVKKGTDSEGAKMEIVAEGDEELEIKGKKIKCHWVDMKLTSKQGESKMKVWRTAEIIGGAAKMEMITEKPMKMTMSMVAVDWKEGDK